MADMNRRNVLLGLGTAAAGSGIVFGSGAFTQIEADRDVSITIVDDDDGSGAVTLAPNAEVEGVNADGGAGSAELQIDDDDLLSNATIEYGDATFDNGGTVNTDAFVIDVGDAGLGTDDSVTVRADNQEGLDEFKLAVDPTDFGTNDDVIATGDSGSNERAFTVEAGAGGSNAELDVAAQFETIEDPTDVDGEITITVDRTDD